MANLLLRDLDEGIVKQLKAAAKAHGRSLQAEIHDVLRNASTRSLAETRRLSAAWLKRLGGPRDSISRVSSTHSDSTASIRQDRDGR
jgi:plasmid stability protein